MLVSTAPSIKYNLSSLIWTGVLICLLGFSGFMAWAALTPLASAIVSTGEIKVDTENKAIQHLEGGIVASLHVREGDVVEQGQLLINLDQTASGTEQQRLQGQLWEMLIRQQLLSAQQSNREDFELDPSQFNPTRDEAVFEQMSAAKTLFQISREVLNNQHNILQEKRYQVENQLKSVDVEHGAKLEELRLVSEEKQSWEKLVNQRYADKLRYLEVQRAETELQGELARLQADESKLQADVKSIELEQFQLVQAYMEKASAELAELELQLSDIQKRLDAATAVVARTEIKAPVAGRIVGMQVHTVGAVIRSGETLLEIVPIQDALVIETRVKPLDIDKVYTDMQARVKLSSYKFHELPEFSGTVTDVSADTFEDQTTGQTFYKVIVSIPVDRLEQMEGVSLHSGMPAEVFIHTGESTPLQYLLEPMRSSFNRAWRES